jgi:glycosyltransferase involved in cell wall biosynthesis
MGRIVRSVLRAAASEEIEVTLLTHNARPWPDDPEAELLATMRFARPRSARASKAYDVIWYPWNGIRFRAAMRSLAHIHDTFALHERGNWIARRRVRKPLRRAAREADRIATDSNWSATMIRKELRVPPERIATILLAPDPFFTPGDENDRATLPVAPYVMLVGAGEPRKNARFLVESFSDAFAHDGVTLVVVGSFSADAERAALERGIMLHREEHASDVRLRALYRNAACVAVPSLAEGFGLVVVEAQACGAPVIASNASSLPEAAGEAAILLAPDDRAGWRDALREVTLDETVALRLRALGVSRWGFQRRDGPARAILAVLRDLVDEQT